MRELQNLYGVLLEQDLISIDFNQFASKINDENYKGKVYNAVIEGDLYSGSYVDFQNKFFPTKAATTTKPTTTPQQTSSELQGGITEEQKNKFREESIDYDFWNNQEYKREDYFLKDGNWHYRNPETQKEVDISNTKNEGTKKRLEKLIQEETDYNETVDRVTKYGEAPKIEDFKDGKVIKTFLGTINIDYENAKKTYDSKIKGDQITGNILEQIDETEKERNNLLIEKESIVSRNKQGTKEGSQDHKRLKEINSRLKEIEGIRDAQDSSILENRKERGKAEMPDVTEDLLKMDDSDSLALFQEKYGKYGFYFEIRRDEGDYVTVHAVDGTSKKFKVQAGHIDPKELNEWMRSRATLYDSGAEALVDIVANLSTERNAQNEADKLVKEISEYKNKISKYTSHQQAFESAGGKNEYTNKLIEEYESNPDNKGIPYAVLYTDQGFPVVVKASEQSMPKYSHLLGYDPMGSGPGAPGLIKGEKNYYEDALDIVAYEKYVEEFGDDPELLKIINYTENEDYEYEDKYGENRSSKIKAWEKIRKGLYLDKEDLEKDMYNDGMIHTGTVDDQVLQTYKRLIEEDSELNTDFIIKEVTNIAEGMGGNFFVKGEAQETIAKDIEVRFNELNEELQKVAKQDEILKESIKNLQGDGKTYGIDYLAKWLTDREKTLEVEIKEITKRTDRNSEEEVAKANAEIKALIDEFSLKYNEFESLRKQLKSTFSAAISLQEDVGDAVKSESEFALMSDLMNRNYQLGPQLAHSLVSATVDLAQGILTAGEAAIYYANPFGRIGDFLVEATGNNEVLKAFVDTAQLLTGVEDASVRFDDDASTSSYSQMFHEGIDAWQQEYDKKIQRPPSYDDIDSFSDFGEWFGTMFAGQVPQLAMMIATGGSSAIVSGALLSASAGGSHFMGMEEQKRLFEKYVGTDKEGLYGRNFGIDQMFFSSAAVGIAEGLSEQVTFGQLSKVRGFMGKPGVKEGFLTHLRKNVFTKDFANHLGRGFKDLGEEGVSEVLATLSQNTVDVINGQKEFADIYEGVEASFVSGALISATIKTPIIFHHMAAPFIDPDNMGIINRNNARVEQLLGMLSMGRPTKSATEEEIKKWEQLELEYITEIAELQNQNKEAMSYSVKRVNTLNDQQKQELLDLHSEQVRIQKEYNENNTSLTPEQNEARKEELKEQFEKNDKRRDDILGSVTPDIVDKRYTQDVEAAKKRAAERNALGGTQVEVTEGNDIDMFDLLANTEGYNVTRNEDGSIQNITLQPGARKGLINQMKEALQSGKLNTKETKMVQRDLDFLESGTDIAMSPDDFFRLNGSKSNYGVQIPVFDNNGQLKEQKVFINKARSLDAGKFYTASHELLHAILHQTLKRDPELQEAFGTVVLNALNNTGVKIPEALKDNINRYTKEEGRGEEIMALLSEAVREGDVKLPGTAIRNMKRFFSRWSQDTTNRDISFDTDQDVINFIQDYSYSMKNNKENKAITRMWSSKDGASGKLIADAQAEYRKRVEQNKVDPGESMFSKNVEQTMSSQPDLMSEIDSFVKNPDGTPKYKTQNEFINSVDGGEAYNLITNTKKLDGLIQAGIMAQGINTPQAIGEFTRNVKDKLGERLLKNFDPAKNDSLFGWLTGVSGGAGQSIIYRAKGDVMVDYKKQLQTTSADVGVRTDTGETIGTQFEADVDTDVQAFENEIIIPGSNVRVNKNQTDVVFLESVNAKVTQSKVNLVVENAGVNLQGLTYNGTKKMLVQHDGGKPKSKRKPTGPLYGALQSVSNLFGVDSIRIIKEQDLTGTQRTLAREYIKENAQQLIDMLPEGENRSGDATGVANTVLGEFYVKGERISMSESGTGKGKFSQTKRDNITTQEFIEFFNKPGTKSDGAIRALITQAATISTNQAIRLDALNKSTDTISTIALVGDGKSAKMFSKRQIPSLNDKVKPVVQGIGKITRNLNTNDTSYFYDNIVNFASQKIVDTNIDSIRIALTNTYGDNVGIMLNIDQISKSIHDLVKQFKPKVINNPIELGTKLVETDMKVDVLVKESSNSPITNAEAYRDEKRRNKLIALNQVFVNKIFDSNNIENSLAKILILKSHLASASTNPNSSKAWFKVSQILKGNVDFIPEIVESIPGIKVNTAKSKSGAISIKSIEYKNPNDPNAETVVVKPENISTSQKSSDALKDVEAFENGDSTKLDTRDANENTAQDLLNDYVAFWSDMFKKGDIDNTDLMMVKSGLLAGMNTILARAGKLAYISDKARALIKKDGDRAKVRYEHMPPRVQMVNDMFNKYINGNGIPNARNYFKEFKIQIITQQFDKAIGDAKLGSSLLEGTNVNTPDVGIARNYNDRTIDDPRVESIRDIRTGQLVVPSEAHVRVKELLNKQRKESRMFSKAVNNANAINENTPSRGASVFDFDETLIDKGENTIIATKGDDVVEISSGNWPLQGPQYAADGYTFDFSDFINVKGGVEGPLMQKFRNRIKKYGIENNYILTARPAEAAPAIQSWLKTKGIDMPIENITGLGNSTGEAKALWIAEKYSEGYNDMYFVDDALPNVKAVKDMMDQLDIKGKSVQAKIQFSKRIKNEFSNIINRAAQQEMDLDFNRILEQTKGVKAESRFSDAQAKVRGSKKGKYSFFVPPSAEDFKGLIYRFLSKGKVGEQQMAFFKKALFDPFARATTSIDIQKQKIQNEYRQLLKQFPDIKDSLNDVVYNNFTLGQMIRVYNWNKAGFEIPGLSQRDLDNIIKEIETYPDEIAFANSLSIITNQDGGYVQPGEFWLVENIQSDLNKITNEINRDLHLQEFKQNREKIFGEWQGDRLVGPNMNKIEAIYGSNFREALEDILYRMEYGTKRNEGNNRLVNAFNNWANQSVGAIMFFNMRSALLQTISSVNYLNWSDNNPLKAGLALANFPQFLKDFSMIFNSDMLKQRRAGNQRGINEAELAQAVGGVGVANRVKAMLNWLLTKGFLPTQIADSFAIASGGATFFRNRVNSYVKQGYTKTEAETKAFQDFQEITEESQQSSRPDMISQQQASPLGRYILAFKNTPMQYARLMKRAYLDLVNGRGDYKTNVGKIIYYGGIQNLIFNGLQAALGALIGDDEEEDKKTGDHIRIANSMIDSILGGIGFGGNAVMTVKNAILEYNKQNNKKWNSDHTYTMLKLVGFSPTVGSKLRKVYSSIQTEKFNKDVIGEMDMLDIDNPRWSAIANLVSAATNIPLDRLVKKMDNIDAALTEDVSNMERFALLMGWNTWDLGIEDQDIIAVENEIKEKKQIEIQEKKKKKKEEKELQIKTENEAKEQENRDKNDGRCVAITTNGSRCKREAIEDGYCTIHAKVEQGTEEVQCSKIKSDGERCKMKTKNKSGLCYYHD